MAFVQNPLKIRSYRIAPCWSHSMHEAEVTVASDYTKEHHVIRLRLSNGPQYLITTQTEKEKNDWIMTMESSMNISSDLDERSMPQFITLLSRRRRIQQQQQQNNSVVNGGNRLLTVAEQRDAPLL
jgi:frataxin-like iron-binding protein CyaY